MSNWIERIKNYDDVVKDLKAINKACVDKESDKDKLKNKIEKLTKELQESEDLRKKQVLEGQAVVQEKQQILKEKDLIIENLRSDISELLKKLDEHESEIKALSHQISILTNKKINLEEKIEFLKNNRRSPNIEELRDYTEKRKRSVKSATKN